MRQAFGGATHQGQSCVLTNFANLIASNAFNGECQRRRLKLDLGHFARQPIRELLPRPKGRGFSAASSLLCLHSPLASGHVLREFSVSVSLAQIYIRFAIQRFGSHRTGSGCSLPIIVARISPQPTSLLPTTNELWNWGSEGSVIRSTFSQRTRSLAIYSILFDLPSSHPGKLKIISIVGYGPYQFI
jgi:hypothetical protein